MDDPEPSAAEIDSWRRANVLVPADEYSAEDYPRLTNLSAGFLYKGMVRPVDPAPPEYATVSMPEGSLEWIAAVARWNMLWEAGQYRRRMLDDEGFPPQLTKLAELR